MVIFLICLSGFTFQSISAEKTTKMIIVVIDGARYSETFGDPGRTYIPRMDQLSEQGSIVDEFYNDQHTYTSRAIPALWCGTWTEVRDTTYQGHSTSYAVEPTIFEYYRKQKVKPAEDCFYILKDVGSLWLQSFEPEYGPDYWPQTLSEGNTDTDVYENAIEVMQEEQPHFLWVYFAETDHAGHSGNWQEYTSTLRRADSLVGLLWEKVQSDPFYQHTTTMIVTNDHGRHDDQHGGFQHHGCGCDGCRHIMFLAIGPDIKAGHTSLTYREIPDMAVTAAALIGGIDTEQSTGNVITEILQPTAVSEITENREVMFLGNYPNPFDTSTTFKLHLNLPAKVSLSIYDASGKVVYEFATTAPKGDFSHEWKGTTSNGTVLEPGVYIYHIETGDEVFNGKCLLE